jgi:hypothetical protein
MFKKKMIVADFIQVDIVFSLNSRHAGFGVRA